MNPPDYNEYAMPHEAIDRGTYLFHDLRVSQRGNLVRGADKINCKSKEEALFKDFGEWLRRRYDDVNIIYHSPWVWTMLQAKLNVYDINTPRMKPVSIRELMGKYQQRLGLQSLSRVGIHSWGKHGGIDKGSYGNCTRMRLICIDAAKKLNQSPKEFLDNGHKVTMLQSLLERACRSSVSAVNTSSGVSQQPVTLRNPQTDPSSIYSTPNVSSNVMPFNFTRPSTIWPSQGVLPGPSQGFLPLSYQSVPPCSSQGSFAWQSHYSGSAGPWVYPSQAPGFTSGTQATIGSNPMVEGDRVLQDLDQKLERQKLDLERMITKLKELESSYGTPQEPIGGATANPTASKRDCIKIDCKLCFSEIEEFCALVPCGHANLCYKCAMKIKRNGCPFCREVIRSVLKIFI